MMYCKYCGKKIDEDSIFCKYLSKSIKCKKSEKILKNDIIIIIVFILIFLLWFYNLQNNGTEKNVEYRQIIFISEPMSSQTKVNFFIINGEVPINIKITNLENFNKTISGQEYRYIKEYNIGSYEKIKIEFITENEGIWGLMITPDINERANFKYQIRKPFYPPHFFYTWTPLIFLLIFLFLIAITNHLFYK